MTIWQIIGCVIGGLLVLYIGARLIFSAWYVTRDLHSTKDRSNGNS